MRKRGFTLAEVMVAMALIGVIASLTIPTFISSNRNKANAAKLATVVSSVENAFTSMIAAEGVQDLSETEFGKAPNAGNLGKYLKLAGNNTTLNSYYGTDTPFQTLSKSASQLAVTNIFQTQNGALLIFHSHAVARAEATVKSLGGGVTDSIGHLSIDTNGAAKPNLWGRDVFYFRIGNDGILYPAGSLNFSILESNNATNLWDSDSSSFKCTAQAKNTGCTARLMENNYEVDF